MANQTYLSTYAKIMEGSTIKSWVVVLEFMVICVLSGVIYYQNTKPLQVLTIPGAAPGIYTAGEVPLRVINSYADSFVKDLTNYDEYSFATNINHAAALMTSDCRAKHRAEIQEWKKTLLKFDMSKSFYPNDTKVVSQQPYTLEFSGDFADRNSDGKAILEGTQTVTVVIVPSVRTNGNFLGYSIDDYHIQRQEKTND